MSRYELALHRMNDMTGEIFVRRTVQRLGDTDRIALDLYDKANWV